MDFQRFNRFKKFDSIDSNYPNKIGDLLAMAITDNIEVFSNCPIKKFNDIFDDLDIFAFIGLLLLSKRCINSSISIADSILSYLNEGKNAFIIMEFYKKDFENVPDLSTLLENVALELIRNKRSMQ